MQQVVILIKPFMSTQEKLVEVFAIVVNIIHRDSIVNNVFHSFIVIQMKTFKAHMLVRIVIVIHLVLSMMASVILSQIPMKIPKLEHVTARKMLKEDVVIFAEKVFGT